jgi:hypothetical protein
LASENNALAMVKQHLLLMYGSADVQVSDRIVRIWDEDDVVIHAGSFSVEELLQRRAIDGKVHHLSLRLERVESTWT